MWPLGSMRHWQSSWCAKVAAEDTSWALLSPLGAPPLAQCSPTLTFGPKPIHLHRFVDSPGWVHASFGSSCSSTTCFPLPQGNSWFTHWCRRKKRESGLLHHSTGTLAYHAVMDFSSGVGSSSSFRLAQPCFSPNTSSVQQMQFQFNEQSGEGERPMHTVHYMQKLACPHKSSI